jgi:class 3 adenylate cyclase
MAKVKLKSIISSQGKVADLLVELCEQFNEDLCITDAREKILFGKARMDNSRVENINHNEEVIGKVSGGGVIRPIAMKLIESLIEKEAQKKDIGNEVLDLYREINLIYNFSEQLASHIDPYSIGKLALDEANKLLRTQGGSVILWERSEADPVVLAEFGSSWDQLHDQADNFENLRKLLAHENSEIFNRTDLPELINTLPGSIDSVLFAPLKVNDQNYGAIYLVNDPSKSFKAADLKLLTTIALQSASAIESSLMYEKRIKEAREREETMKRVQEVTSRFVPFEFLKSLGLSSLMDAQLGDQVENVVTVVFVDIRGFTTLAERMTPEENFRFVNAFNGRLGPIIKENNGFVNQYLGDGIMAIFPHKPADALRGAVKMQLEIQNYNAYRKIRNRLPIRMGIGIHTGPLIMGITGDNERWDAATISDTVNTAGRIESLTKYYKCNIIFSHQTLSHFDKTDLFNTRPLGLVQVKGREKPIRIFECFDGDKEHLFKLKQETLTNFNSGVDSYVNKSFRDSTKSFSQVLVANPDDETAQCFLGKISNLLT